MAFRRISFGRVSEGVLSEVMEVLD